MNQNFIELEQLKSKLLAQEIRQKYKQLRASKISLKDYWDYRKSITNYETNQDKVDFFNSVINKLVAASKRLREYEGSLRYQYKIRKYCNERGFTDVRAYEVIKVISDKTVEVRRLDAKLKTQMEFQAGGFSANCTNNDQQEYEFTQNTDNPILRIRLSKKGWGNGKFWMSDKPTEHYDFNF